MREIIFRDDGQIFSYRVAGILVRDGKILLQRPPDDDGFSLPGGHIEFGETSTQTLVREFLEEIGAEIEVGELKWVGENFFPWGNRVCHQISLYYSIALKDASQIPSGERFTGSELMDGVNSALEFHWLPLESLDSVVVYPATLPHLMKRWNEGVQHFISRQ